MTGNPLISFQNLFSACQLVKNAVEVSAAQIEKQMIKGAEVKAMAVFVHVEECTLLCSADRARAALAALSLMLLL